MTYCKTSFDLAYPDAKTSGTRSVSRFSILRAGIAVVVMLMSTALASATERIELRLASDLWPPFTNTADQSRLAIDLVHEALNRADIEATTSIVDFGAVILGLQDGSFDGCGALWRTTERENISIGFVRT